MANTSFEEALERINEDGSFEAAVLATADGLPIATVASDYDTEITSAMVALLRSVAQQARDQVGMAPTEEVSVRGTDHVRLVSRFFQMGDEDFILAVMVPSKQRYYRQLTSRAIRELRRTWRTLMEG